jgi:nucleoid-associated protein EbfC
MASLSWLSVAHTALMFQPGTVGASQISRNALLGGDRRRVDELTSSNANASSRRRCRQGGAMDLMKMMKQAQEIQGRMQKMQEELTGLEVEGQSGAGLVKVKLNGKLDIRGLKIDPSLIKPEDAEMLEDLIVAAFQDAKTKAEAAVHAKMQEVTGGLALPPGLKLPF